MVKKKRGNLYCCGGAFDQCDEPATWIRHTQFSGDHPFCTKHAKKEKDFGESDSYKDWAKIPKNQVAPPKPKVVKLSNVITDLEAEAKRIKNLPSENLGPTAQVEIVARVSKLRKIARKLRKVTAL